MTSSIYAETLINLRHVTVCISFNHSSDVNTRLSLSADGKELDLSHQGHISVVQFPIAVANAAPLKLPSQPTKEFSVRLPFTEKSRLDQLRNHSIAWSADALKEVVELTCQACGETLIGRRRIEQWKDLPNEDWAEMMDLWHCHKPNNSNGENGHDLDASKGYTASTRLTAQLGVGLIGVSSALFSSEDCANVKVGFSFTGSLT